MLNSENQISGSNYQTKFSNGVSGSYSLIDGVKLDQKMKQFFERKDLDMEKSILA